MNDLLELSGTARERGRAHGEALRQEIRDRIAVAQAGATDTETAPWWNATVGAAPAIAEEMTGIAEGAACRLEDVLLLNSFEMLTYAIQAELGVGGCTVIGVSRPGRAPILAQNWDAKPSAGFSPLRPHLHRGPDTLTTLVLASPGGVGWIGMNEAGVALVNADLRTHRLRVGVPSKVMRRLILAEHDRSAGLQKLSRFGAVGGRTYLVGDVTGADLIEVAAEEPAPVSVPSTGDGWFHANHAVSSQIATCERTDVAPSSRPRYARVAELMRSLKPSSADEIITLLADHDGRPHSICRHEDEEQSSITAASVIFDCDLRRASVAIGNPCTEKFHTYQL